MKIVIVDYKLGNLSSIKNMLFYLGFSSSITNSKEEILSADRIILPGVGSFGEGIKNLKELDLIEVLNYKVLEKETPILGICLGFQLMTKYSEEGAEKGLGWFNAETLKFDFKRTEELDLLKEKHNKRVKIPHMGWNFINRNGNSNTINREKFYFVHSYYVKTNDESETFMTTNYGINFDSGLRKKNITGVQFHPEKSHKYGMNLFKEFLK